MSESNLVHHRQELFARWFAAFQQVGQCHVLVGSQRRYEVVGLEDESNVAAAHFRQSCSGLGSEIHAVEPNLTTAGVV